jgi:ABC-type enterochelin transport system permease subunit
MSFLRDPKRLLATLLTGITGLLVLIASTGQVSLLNQFAETAVVWATTLAAIALLIGVLSVAGGHVARIIRRNSDWGYSLILILSMLAVIISGTLIGAVSDSQGNPGYVLFPSSLVEQPVRDVFRAFYQPLAGSFLALLSFFSLTAALRALRHRTADAFAVTIVALLVLIGSALPAEVLPVLGDSLRWASDYIALAGARALLIGSAIGAVIAGVRVLLGFDQPFLDR